MYLIPPVCLSIVLMIILPSTVPLLLVPRTFGISRRSIQLNAGSEGQVLVCTNRWCRERGSDATMATFSFLCPDAIPITGVNCLGRCNKGPNARIVTTNGTVVDASMVRSVESVASLLKTYLSLDINATSAEALRLNYEGNVHLRNGDVDQAIECYNIALGIGDKEQEGILLVMRGTALLQRCYASRLRYKDLMFMAQGVLPTIEGISSTLGALCMMHPYVRATTSLQLLLRTRKIFENLDLSSTWTEVKLRWPEAREGKIVRSGEDLISRAAFAWYVYEHSLIFALQDLLAATIILPGFAQAWRRSGDALSEMLQFRSAIEYYEVAIKLDSTLVVPLSPTIERLRVLERIVENAEAKGWPLETVLSIIDD